MMMGWGTGPHDVTHFAIHTMGLFIPKNSFFFLREVYEEISIMKSNIPKGYEV